MIIFSDSLSDSDGVGVATCTVSVSSGCGEVGGLTTGVSRSGF